MLYMKKGAGPIGLLPLVRYVLLRIVNVNENLSQVLTNI